MDITLKDLIDIELFQNLLDRLNEIYSFPSAIVDIDGTILTATAWQDICTQFHRKNKESERVCRKNDQYILSHVHDANPGFSYRCPHGLVENATPIIIDGVHYGNFFTGQFFLEVPDPESFRAQAEKYGYDTEAYLSALKKVPIWPKGKLNNYLFLIKGLIAVICEIGMKNLKEIKTRKTIEENEARYRSILQTSLDGFWLTDTKGRLLEVNDSYCRMSGYSEDELLKMNISDFKAVENPENPPASHLNSVLEKGHDRFESKHRRKDGSFYDVEISVQYRPFEGGRFVCFIRDITERKATEDALRKNQDMLNKVIDTVPQSIFWKDSEGRYMGCNRVFASAAGLEDPSRIIGLTDYDLPWPQEEADAYRADDREVMEKNRPKHHIIEPLLHSSGKRIWVDTSKAPLVDENNRTFGVLGIYDDITERKQIEEALEKRIITLTRPLDDPKHIEFEDLFNKKDIQRLQDEFAKATGVASIITCPDGTPITDPSNFCRLCSDIIRKTEKGCANCFRSDAELGRLSKDGPKIQPCLSGGLWDAGAGIEVGGKHLANWLIGQVRDETQTEEKMRNYAKDIGADEDQVIKAFREVPAMSRDKFGHVSQVLFTLANQLSTFAYQNVQQARLISDLKKAENEQKQLQSQLIQAQKMESVGRLAGGVAHDFNNMLSIISGNTELILEDLKQDSGIRDNLQEILKATQRSIDLTRQLLAFARKQTIAPKVLDLNTTIEGMLKMLGRLIGEDIHLKWREAQNLWPVKVDPSQIDQILANLCANARDCIKGVGKVTIETGNFHFDDEYSHVYKDVKPGDYVMISVSDNGCGMDRATLDNLFEPFFTTKDIGKGTGLGLSTVYGIVQQNQGFIHVYSEVDIGTSFKIYLPRYSASEVLPLPPVIENDYKGGKEVILLVEDEKGILRMTTMMLEQLGYTVIATSNPAEALSICESYSIKIDMLMTDVVMPEMSGRDLVEKLLTLYPNLKYLFSSGYTDNVIAHHGVLDEGIQFINKPFTKQNLAAKIREVLDEDKSGSKL